jgi:hypothetical protein
LQALLHLDVSVLRNPLVGLTVLAPVLSALIAAYVPGAKSCPTTAGRCYR